MKEKESTVRRFSAIEVVFHALQAIFYLPLFCTGMLLLLQRLFDVHLFNLKYLANIHRGIGITLTFVLALAILLSLFVKSFRQLWFSIWDTLKWSRQDIIWFLRMPLHIFNHKVTLPPSGRFNPGQKLHLVTILLILIGFNVSGLMIILIPGGLGAWLIHLACFVPATIFLFIHFFLSLINPPTRKALKGMLTGHVSSQYANQHHPLTNGQVQEHHTVHIYRTPLIGALIVCVLLSCFLIYRYGLDRFNYQIDQIIASKGSLAILPGELSASHHNDHQASQCLSCHLYFSSPPSKNCLSCHAEIQKVLDEKIGYHGQLTGECRSCHTDHAGKDFDIRRLDKESFNHQQARFPLKGMHKKMSCEKCHLKDKPGKSGQSLKYINLAFTGCTGCHVSPHPDIKTSDCLKCHSLEE